MWNELKPCPFCGSNNIVIYDKSFNSGPYYDIFCRDCQASVRFADESETEEGAVNMWNTRIAPERCSHSPVPWPGAGPPTHRRGLENRID